MTAPPPFPYRRPGTPYETYHAAVARWMTHPAVRVASLQRAVASGHGEEWRDEWYRSPRIARRLRAYICWRLDPSPAPEPPAGVSSNNVDEELLAAINAMGAAAMSDMLAALAGVRLHEALTRLRERGDAVLAEHPDLGEPMAGPPVAVRLRADPPDEPPPTEDDVTLAPDADEPPPAPPPAA